ncbi:hypothetical protein BC938DRAFT_483811, partial [Jimgerdemannia flammicorona]
MEHHRYTAELTVIKKYYADTSEMGRKILKWMNLFKRERKSSSVKNFWEIRQQRQLIRVDVPPTPNSNEREGASKRSMTASRSMAVNEEDEENDSDHEDEKRSMAAEDPKTPKSMAVNEEGEV